MKNAVFTSAMAPYIEGLLAQKRALGYKYDVEEYHLGCFDRYWAETNGDSDSFTMETVAGWMKQRTSEDQLSDNVYNYDAQARVFELAGNYEQRIKDEQSLENEVGILAADLDQFAYEYDTHGYHDAVEDRDQNVASIREELG